MSKLHHKNGEFLKITAEGSGNSQEFQESLST